MKCMNLNKKNEAYFLPVHWGLRQGRRGGAQELPPTQTEVSQEILLISCYLVLVAADVSHKGLNQHQAEMSQLHSSFINTTV